MFISIINYDCEILFDEKVSNRPVIHKATDFFSLLPANQINSSNKIELSVEAENEEPKMERAAHRTIYGQVSVSTEPKFDLVHQQKQLVSKCQKLFSKNPARAELHRSYPIKKP